MTIHTDSHLHFPLDLSGGHRVALIAVTGSAAAGLVVFHDRDVAEIHQVGLSGKRFPWLVGVLESAEKGFFLGGGAVMTCFTVGNRRYPSKPSITVITMAELTIGGTVLGYMGLVVEWKVFLRLNVQRIITGFLKKYERCVGKNYEWQEKQQ